MSLSFKARTTNPRVLLAIKVCAVVSLVAVGAAFLAYSHVPNSPGSVQQVAIAGVFAVAVLSALVALGLCWWQLWDLRVLHQRRVVVWQLCAGFNVLHVLFVSWFVSYVVLGSSPQPRWLDAVPVAYVLLPHSWLLSCWGLLLWAHWLFVRPKATPGAQRTFPPLAQFLTHFKVVAWVSGLVLAGMSFAIWLPSPAFSGLLFTLWLCTPFALGALLVYLYQARQQLQVRGALASPEGRWWRRLVQVTSTILWTAGVVWVVNSVAQSYAYGLYYGRVNQLALLLLTLGLPVVLGCVVWAYRLLADYQRRW